LRFQRAAFPAPFANFPAAIAFLGKEARFTAPSQLNVPDDLRLRGERDAHIQSKIKNQLLKLFSGHIRLQASQVLQDERRVWG
jgi:hypothetical protein